MKTILKLTFVLNLYIHAEKLCLNIFFNQFLFKFFDLLFIYLSHDKSEEKINKFKKFLLSFVFRLEYLQLTTKRFIIIEINALFSNKRKTWLNLNEWNFKFYIHRMEKKVSHFSFLLFCFLLHQLEGIWMVSFTLFR